MVVPASSLHTDKAISGVLSKNPEIEPLICWLLLLFGGMATAALTYAPGRVLHHGRQALLVGRNRAFSGFYVSYTRKFSKRHHQQQQLSWQGVVHVKREVPRPNPSQCKIVMANGHFIL